MRLTLDRRRMFIVEEIDDGMVIVIRLLPVGSGSIDVRDTVSLVHASIAVGFALFDGIWLELDAVAKLLVHERVEVSETWRNQFIFLVRLSATGSVVRSLASVDCLLTFVTGRLPLGRRIVEIVECWGDDVTSWFTVQRWVQVSVAVNVARASDRDL